MNKPEARYCIGPVTIGGEKLKGVQCELKMKPNEKAIIRFDLMGFHAAEMLPQVVIEEYRDDKGTSIRCRAGDVGFSEPVNLSVGGNVINQDIEAAEIAISKMLEYVRTNN